MQVIHTWVKPDNVMKVKGHRGLCAKETENIHEGGVCGHVWFKALTQGMLQFIGLG